MDGILIFLAGCGVIGLIILFMFALCGVIDLCLNVKNNIDRIQNIEYNLEKQHRDFEGYE